MKNDMYLKRKIDDILESWFAGRRLPLIVKGARQVGKTASIRVFAATHYENVIEVNFISEPKYRHVLDYGYSAQDIVNALTW